jgi:hypothetical protein
MTPLTEEPRKLQSVPGIVALIAVVSCTNCI